MANVVEAALPPPARGRFALGWHRSSASDLAWRGVLVAFGLSIPLLLLGITLLLWRGAMPAISRFGGGFVGSSEWDPVSDKFGGLPFIFGTIGSSVIAVAIAVPLSIGLALFLTELAPRWLAAPIAFATELLAAIPSVVYGLWAVFVLVPFLRDHVQTPLSEGIGGTLGIFAGPAYGPSLLAGGVILAIMIIPFISAVSREVIAAVPPAQREAALALGATRWESTWQVVLPAARAGLIGAVMLGLGRAIGETMAVTMVIGNTPQIPHSLFAPAYTMASVLANEFAEASGDVHRSALMLVALLLLGVTLVVNAMARALVWRVNAGTRRAA
ncbi:phosphate ABC transporter permease subunit PstC [Longimicrobium sp.]|uniref:phosphate ABC transporter permease subunit PstC n=1 Tax=Longimicrobium sp. TaxID=2029185 RepID=UPI002C54AF6D|nr:phosphate ABC transporter permease subunit PstC [Longimicrobium sp.]HSU13250.1 phosphate ABC transporter permease subunit PstC [Longimicrobium sp.]